MKPRDFINTHLEVDYDTTLFQEGLEWINNFWLFNEEIVKTMSYSKLFWKWWSMQWKTRTLQCVYNLGMSLNEKKLNTIEKEALLEAYNTVHSINNTKQIYPSNTLLNVMLGVEVSEVNI